MYWHLLPHLSACVVGETLYLLDIRQDRYLMVPSTLSGSVLAWISNPHETAVPHDFSALLRRSGCLVPADQELQPVPGAAVHLPMALPSARGQSATFREIATVARLVLTMRRSLGQQRLAALLAPKSSLATTRGSNTSKQIALAQKFGSARRFVPVQPRCLVDSLALRHWLAQEGERPQMVFGVSSAPFAAHCWLQNRDAILNDSYDRVSRFTPIRVV